MPPACWSTVPRRWRRLPAGSARGATQGDLAILDADAVGGPGSPSAPVVACWEGRIVGVGSAGPCRAGSRGEWLRTLTLRAHRRGWRRGHPRPDRPPHAPAVRRLARGRAGHAAAGRRLPGHPCGGWRDPVHRGGHAPGFGRAARPARAPLAGRDEPATASRRWRRSPATAWTWRRSCACWRSPTSSARRARSTWSPPSSGRTRCHPSTARVRTAPRRTCATVIEEQLPGVAAQGRARSCDVFCEQGVFTADQSRRILLAAAGYGMALRLHADELAPSGGAELAAELGALSADHLHVPSDEGLAALAAAAAGPSPTVATLLPATTWFLMTDEAAPARRFIDAGVPVALGTDFNPGTSPTASLPLVMTVACLAHAHVAGRDAGRGHDQRRARGGRRRRRRGRSSRARPPIS